MKRSDKVLLVLAVILLLLAGFFMGQAEAAESQTRIVLNLKSYHIHTPDLELEESGFTEFNEDNLGLGFEYRFKDSNKYVGAGVFENSYFEKSTYITAGYVAAEYFEDGVKTSMSFELNIADGYEKSPYANGDLMVSPAAIFGVGFGDEYRHGIKLMAMTSIVGLQYTYLFKNN